jgi:hypothetical protein
MAEEYRHRVPRILDAHRRAQEEMRENARLASDLYRQAVELLVEQGVRHTFWVDRVLLTASLPLTFPLHLGEFWHPKKALSRFFEKTQDTYLCRTLEGSDTPAVLITANNGDPTRARVLEIGLTDSNEVMLFKYKIPSIVCTPDHPKYSLIDPAVGSHGQTLRGRYKELAAPGPDDFKDYFAIIEALRAPNPDARNMRFGFLPAIKGL